MRIRTARHGRILTVTSVRSLRHLVALALMVGSLVAVGSGSPSNAANTLLCKGEGIDIGLCVVEGRRPGTFIITDATDGTVVVSVPSDSTSCPDQVFEVTLDYPTVKPILSVPPSQRIYPVATVDASSSSCSRAAPSRVLRLERSEARYGLGPSDLLEGFYAPSAASIESISSSELIPTPNAGLAGIRPQAAVDSLTRFEGLLTTVVGKPCSRAKHRVACQARYAKALANPQAYGRANCGRCPVSPPALALLFTRGDNVRFVSDLRAFLGPIDTAADAVLLAAASDAVARLDGGAWLVKRSEIDGTCDPFERADVFEKISRDGRVTQVARVLASRQFGVCA